VWWWRRRRQQREWLDGWEPVVAERLGHWSALDADERARLGALVEWMVRSKHWEAARGFELTQEIVLTVAAKASLLILGLDRDVYRDVKAVIIHPRTITRRGVRATTIRGVVTDRPLRVLGHTLDRRGPVVIAWNAVQRDARRPQRGHDVVLHEFAHKIDAVDGLFDGTPEIADRSERAEWVRVCTAEYRRLRRHRDRTDPVLRRYAARSPSEFFAVATEAFFDMPCDLEEHKPRLYDVLRGFYGQDPAARVRRSSG
jgi:Mlc titration factor MtfA (ptsG expression regulator)